MSAPTMPEVKIQITFTPSEEKEGKHSMRLAYSSEIALEQLPTLLMLALTEANNRILIRLAEAEQALSEAAEPSILSPSEFQRRHKQGPPPSMN